MSYLSNFLPENRHTGLNIAVIGASGGIGMGFLNHLANDDQVDRLYACSRSRPKTSPEGVEQLELDILKSHSSVIAWMW